MFRNLRLACAAALVACSLLPSLASAAVTYRNRSAGSFATANFIGVDPTGCIYTDTSLFVFDFRVREGFERPEDVIWIDFYSTHIDSCNGGSVTSFYAIAAALPAGDFRAHGLQSAALQTTIEVSSYEDGSTVPVTLDLVWTGEGEISGSRRTRTGRYRGPDGMYMALYKGVFRSADVSGSILFESLNVAVESHASGGEIGDIVEADMVVTYGQWD